MGEQLAGTIEQLPLPLAHLDGVNVVVGSDLLSNLQANGREVSLSDGQGIATISNDDTATLAISDTSISEGHAGTSTASFTISLSQPVDTAITVDVATSDGSAATSDHDYQALATTTLIFNPGETSKTVAVSVNGDTKAEGNETFFLNLNNLQANGRDVSISDGQAIGTISNDDIPPTITSGNLATALENAPPSTVVYTATAINNTGSASEIAWSLADANANDFTINSSGQLRFKTSPDYEAKSSFNLEIIATDRNGTGSSAAKAISVSIIDQAVLAISNATVDEGSGNAVFTISAVDPISDGVSIASVSFATANGSAFGSTDSSGDYLRANGVLSFATGDLSKSISVSINEETLYEPTPELFSVNLSNPVNASISKPVGIGTINDNDTPPTLSVLDCQTLEGNSGTTQLLFTVNLSARTGQDVVVNFSLSDGTATVADNDYAASTGSLRLSAGTLSQVISVRVNGDLKPEADETLTLTLSNPLGAVIQRGTAIGTIKDDDNLTDTITFTGTAGSDNLKGNPAAPPVTVAPEIFQGLAGDDYLFGYYGENTFVGGVRWSGFSGQVPSLTSEAGHHP